MFSSKIHSQIWAAYCESKRVLEPCDEWYVTTDDDERVNMLTFFAIMRSV